MNAMNQVPPADFAGMTDRLWAVTPILVAGIAVVGLVIWLSMKWRDARRDARNFRKYVEVVDDVRKSGGGKLSPEDVDVRAFAKYLEVVDTKAFPGSNTKDKK